MYQYSTVHWILFFYLYCFIGWIWESCYVSIRKGSWVNRGFLNGPWLPIYGFGVIIILFVTMPVRDNLILTYLTGMIGATVLEYFTGAAMEAIFHMRYWDYSEHRFNLNGHICLGVSLGWGVFAVLLVWWVHKPFESVILMIPEAAALVLDIILTGLFVWDVIVSTKSALDMKKILLQIEKEMEKLAEIERKRQEAAALRVQEAKERLENAKENMLENVTDHVQELREAKERIEQELAELRLRSQERFETLIRRNPSAKTRHYREGWKVLLEKIKNRIEE